MVEIKDKIVTVESLSTLHQYNKDTYTSTVVITIPDGSMLGDIDGDGQITDLDINMLDKHMTGSASLNEEQMNRADINKDGVVNIRDKGVIQNIINGTASVEYINWESNPNYESDEMRFYKDFVVEDMTASDFAIVTIVNDNQYKFRAECLDGKLRLYVDLCPVSELIAIVQYGRGNQSGATSVNSLDQVVSIKHGGTGSSDGASGLANLFASGSTILSSYQYGDTLPAAGTAGRIFFKKINQ